MESGDQSQSLMTGSCASDNNFVISETVVAEITVRVVLDVLVAVVVDVIEGIGVLVSV